MPMAEKKVDSFDLIDKLLDNPINEPKYLMSENTERKNTERQHDLYEKRIREIEEELNKLKKKAESEEQVDTEYTRWITTRPTNRISSMSVPASIKEDLFDERKNGESQADVVKRILNEVREYREIEYNIIQILESKEPDEKKVESIKNLIEYDDGKKMTYGLVINNNRIDYAEVEKRYDPDLTDAENAQNIGISITSFITWRNSKGFPARGRKKGSEWNKKSKRSMR